MNTYLGSAVTRLAHASASGAKRPPVRNGNAANLATFKGDPAKYAPQYGGFCSWGVSVGKLFDVDPVNGWKIADGKLYMNFNADINNTFSKDPAGYISKANGHWPALNR